MPPQYPLPSSLEIIDDEISIPLQRTDSLSSAESSALPASPSNLSLSTAATTKPAVDSTTTTSRKNGQYTVEEVAKHNKKDDAWLIYNNQVVDVSKWVSCSHIIFPTDDESFHSIIFSLSTSLSLFLPLQHIYHNIIDIPPSRRRTNHPAICWYGCDR